MQKIAQWDIDVSCVGIVQEGACIQSHVISVQCYIMFNKRIFIYYNHLLGWFY